MDFKLSDVALNSILLGDKLHVVDGSLVFTKIDFSPEKISLYNKDVKVAVIDMPSIDFLNGEIVTLLLTEGSMKLRIS